MGYVTADAGYTFLKAPGAKLGAFVGYNFFSQQLISHGCSQVAGDDISRRPTRRPKSRSPKTSNSIRCASAFRPSSC